MNNYENKEHDVAVNADDFLGGNYLKKEDLKESTTVTVENVWPESVLNAGRKKLVMAFREFEKPLILNKTNIRRLVRIFGTAETALWRGEITLYVEKGVEYGGRIVGGIRDRPVESANARQPIATSGNGQRFDEAEADFDGF